MKSGTSMSEFLRIFLPGFAHLHKNFQISHLRLIVSFQKYFNNLGLLHVCIYGVY